MRVVDVVLAFPFYVLIIALVFVVGSGTHGIYIAFALTDWVVYARTTRSATLVARSLDWVAAAEGGGLSPDRGCCSGTSCPTRSARPIVYAMSDIVLVILAVVTLGYLGLGIQPPAPDWGAMISDGQNFIPTTRGWLRSRGSRSFSPASACRCSVTGWPTCCGPNDCRLGGREPRRRGAASPIDVSCGRRRLVQRWSAGSALGIVGESGCGKSLTLRAIMGLLPNAGRVASGRVTLDGVALRASARHRSARPAPAHGDGLPGRAQRPQPGRDRREPDRRGTAPRPGART